MECRFDVRSNSLKWNVENKRKGQYRVKLIANELKAKGYEVYMFPVEANGVDIIASNETHVLGIEVTNWSEKSYLSVKRLKCMIENWDNLLDELKNKGDKRKYCRVLVYSFISNIKNVLPYLFMYDIELWERKKQDIPPEYEIIGWVEGGEKWVENVKKIN